MFNLVKPWYRFRRMTQKIYQAVNFFCVIFLSVQLLAILYMVVGRYLLRSVPIWTEQLALFSLVWFSMLSIALAEKDDRHIKMELVDFILPGKHIRKFEFFSYIVVLIFSIYMIRYGLVLMRLSARVQMSGLRITEAYLYLSLPVSGACTAIMSLYKIVEKIMEKFDDN